MEEAPICPGCHIGCTLDDPQCARGFERFRPMWLNGEEVPVRRMPGRPGPGGPGGHKGPGSPKAGGRPPRPHGSNDPSQGELLIFLLTEVAPRALGELKGSADDQVLEVIQRHEGGATYCVILERTRLDEPNAYAALESLLENGYIEEAHTEWGTQFYWITPQGRDYAQEAKECSKATIEKRMSALSAEEQTTLEKLISKLIRPVR